MDETALAAVGLSVLLKSSTRPGVVEVAIPYVVLVSVESNVNEPSALSVIVRAPVSLNVRVPVLRVPVVSFRIPVVVPAGTLKSTVSPLLVIVTPLPVNLNIFPDVIAEPAFAASVSSALTVKLP